MQPTKMYISILTYSFSKESIVACKRAVSDNSLKIVPKS